MDVLHLWCLSEMQAVLPPAGFGPFPSSLFILKPVDFLISSWGSNAAPFTYMTTSIELSGKTQVMAGQDVALKK